MKFELKSAELDNPDRHDTEIVELYPILKDKVTIKHLNNGLDIVIIEIKTIEELVNLSKSIDNTSIMFIPFGNHLCKSRGIDGELLIYDDYIE